MFAMSQGADFLCGAVILAVMFYLSSRVGT
jgi:hypothetical protein